MLSRRDFHRLAIAALPASLAIAKPDSKIHGVQIGAQSYSFRDRPLDEAIKGMLEVGLSECELWSGHVEPKEEKGAAGRDALKKWRTTVSMDVFKDVRKKFKDAGILLYAYNYSFRDEFSDEEIQRGFDMAHALGVTRLTASSTVTCAKRVDPFAAKAKVFVGMHGHDNMKPGEFNLPASFEEAMNGSSKYIGINLDIGHFTAAGYDAVAFIKEHHDRITNLHVKDRKKDHGPNVAVWGTGDTPIKGVMQLLKAEKYRFPANLELEYPIPEGSDIITEAKKCLAYVKSCLA